MLSRSSNTGLYVSLPYKHTPSQWSFCEQQCLPLLCEDICLILRDSEFWWFAFIIGFSVISKFEHWLLFPNYVTSMCSIKCLFIKSIDFFSIGMFLFCLICRSALFITNIYTLCWLFMLQTYSHFPFCFFHHPQKKSLLHFIVILTPQPQPLAGTELVSVTTVVPFVKLSISGKKCYKYSQTSVCMNVCYYFSWVTSRSGCGC